MCGIAGFIGRKEIDPGAISRTLKLMENRGPDFQSFTEIPSSDRQIYFLSSRLSIIDLDSRSNQPMQNEGYVISFNGEIYNYIELRSLLEKKGVVFETGSDTEVFLKSFQIYGPACVEKMEGMWAAAIFNPKDQTVFISRDRFGEKPFFYTQQPDGFYFASEIKFIRSLSGSSFSVNEEYLKRFAVLGYKTLYTGSEGFFNGISRLNPGESAEIRPDGSVRFARYWNPDFQTRQMDLEEAVEESKNLLCESIRLRIRSDVPVSFCLSGGVDSTTIASIAVKKFGCNIATYSLIDSDERYNESVNIGRVAEDLGCKNTMIQIRPEKNLNRLRGLVGYHDAPISTISYYIHSLISECVNADGNRLIMSGTSADEIFTGYYDHFNLHLKSISGQPDLYKQAKSDWQKYIAPIVRNPILQDPDVYLKNPDQREHIYLNKELFNSYLKKPIDLSGKYPESAYTDDLLRNRMLNELFHEITPVILFEDDMNSMYYSVENRSPFLDSRLVEFAMSIPQQYLIKDGYAKYVLRQAGKDFVDSRVGFDRHKKGFNAAIRSVFDFDSEELRADLLSDSPVFEYFKREYIQEALKPKEIPNSHSKFLFNFITTKIFLEECA